MPARPPGDAPSVASRPVASPSGASHRLISPVESQLVASGAGDTSAFAELYEDLAPRLHGLVLRILRDEHQAEEVTQEVFLEIWQTCHRFDPDRGTALSWLMTLAHHRAVDRVRGSEARRRRDTRDAERSRPAAFDQTAETAHATIDAQSVHAALARLSPVQREALELAYFGGYTHTEVSRLLELPLGTAKTRIRDGLLRLRGLLATMAVDPA